MWVRFLHAGPNHRGKRCKKNNINHYGGSESFQIDNRKRYFGVVFLQQCTYPLDNLTVSDYTVSIESEIEMKAKNSKFDVSELCGWIGMILIHAATLPTSIGVILGYNDRLPPVSMVLMVWSGLFLFLIRALGRNDKLYIISNAVGFFFNSILLALIVFK